MPWNEQMMYWSFEIEQLMYAWCCLKCEEGNFPRKGNNWFGHWKMDKILKGKTVSQGNYRIGTSMGMYGNWEGKL